MQKLSIILLSLALGACASSAQNYESNVPLRQNVNQDMTTQNLYNMAQNLYAGHDYLGAYNLYGRAFAGAGANSDFKNEIELGMANSLLRLGQADEALLRFNSLSERGVSSIGLNEGIVESHLRLGNIEMAQNKMQALDNILAKSVRAYTLAGILADLELNHEQARVHYGFALEMEGDVANSIVNLALSYGLTGDFETSHALLNSIDNSQESIALIYALEGKLEMAQEVITRVFFNRGLGARAVEQNMNYYNSLAGLSDSARAKAVMLGIVANN